MKNKLNIFSNNNINLFLDALLSEYELTFMKLDSIENNLKNDHVNIIIINSIEYVHLVNQKKLNENSLIISNLNNNYRNINKDVKLLSAPISINLIKNNIKNLVQNLKVEFYDLSIHNDKIINLKNNFHCYLTKVELEILTHIIREKETSKTFIKKNILKIKSNIETNSLESHLTRIRKKMKKIKTNIKIQTKNEKLIVKN